MASCCLHEHEAAESACLQRIVRGAVTRRKIARLRSAAVAIQSAWRGRQAMRRYHTAVQNVTAVQVARTSALGHEMLIDNYPKNKDTLSKRTLLDIHEMPQLALTR